MKRVLFLISLLVIANPVFADYSNCQSSKCTDLMSAMYNNHETLYNVLNLSPDQKKCKNTIDSKYLNEVGNKFQQLEQEKYVLNNMKKHNASSSALHKQEKVVKSIEKSMEDLNDKYEKEFKSILNSEQKDKLHTIRKMEQKELKHCDKAAFKKDPKLRTFGEKMYNEEVLCPVHNKWHIFGFKHKK